jgi:hypothetical protein
MQEPIKPLVYQVIVQLLMEAVLLIRREILQHTSGQKFQDPHHLISFSASASKTIVKNLAAGIYQFELKVNDDGGLFSKDTVQVKVNVFACNDTNRSRINVQVIPIGTLSQTREAIAVASAGNKILFAGGGGWSSRVDIYNITTNSWLTAELSIARGYTAAVAAGSKVFFGGGEISDGTFPTDNVDIFDVTTNTWTVAHLSTAGSNIAAATE